MIRFRLVNRGEFDRRTRAIEAQLDAATKAGVKRAAEVAKKHAIRVYTDKRAAQGKSVRGPRIGEHKAFVDSFKTTDPVGQRGNWKSTLINDAENANIIDSKGRKPGARPMPVKIARKILEKEGAINRGRKSYYTYTDRKTGKTRRKLNNDGRTVAIFRRAAARKGQKPMFIMKATREYLKRAAAKKEVLDEIKRRVR